MTHSEETERMADQLRRVIAGPAWLGPSMLELLDDVPPASAASRPVADAHSIWELVLHTAAWLEIVERRLGGERPQVTADVNFPPVLDTSATAWRRTLDGLRAATDRLTTRVGTLSPADFDRELPGDDATYTVYTTVHGAIQHVAYHAGQIAILKRAR